MQPQITARRFDQSGCFKVGSNNRATEANKKVGKLASLVWLHLGLSLPLHGGKGGREQPA
jgi:hypothetical protein